MKKYFLSIVALAGMLFATSCQESLVEPQVGGPTTFTVQLPDGMGTKATIGGYELINRVYVEVYSANGPQRIYKPTNEDGTYYFDTFDPSTNSATIRLNLIQDQAYDIVFWAQHGESYNVSDLTKVQMNDIHHNSETGAAFFAKLDNFTPGDNSDVELRRPFAQLNLGTTQESLNTNAGQVTLSEAAITVGNIAETFNALAERGEGERTITFIAEEVPSQILKVGEVEYKYISMDYLPIAGNAEALVTVNAEITLGNGQSIFHEFTNVPVKENYRTNIVGNLISSTTDFVVKVNDDWAGEDYKYDSETGKVFVEVGTADELEEAILNPEVGEVVLTNDINLTETLVFGAIQGANPIARASESAQRRDFIFDGNGKTLTSTAARAINISGVDGVTIKNLTIECTGERAINIIQNATNVTIDNVTATAANYTVNVATSAPEAIVNIENSTLNGLCTINVASPSAVVTVDKSTVNCNDNNTTDGESYAALCLNKAAVNGKIIATNTIVNVTEGSDSQKGRNGAEDGVVTINGSTEGVVVTVAVITFEGSDYYYGYASLEEAFEDAQKHKRPVTLIRTITVEEPIVIEEGRTVVLDLNGKTINVEFVEGSTTNHIYAFENHANLTIKGNGTINARGIFNYGVLTLENGTINAIDGNGGYAVRNYEGSEFIMNGGTLATTNEDDNQVDNGGYDATTLRVDEGATAIINGGTIKNICDYTFAIENYGTTTVNDGEITSVHSTVSSYGNLTINGGSFTCNGKEGVTSHALVAWNRSETTINGGEFNGKDNYNGFNIDANDGSLVYIKGGNFLKVHSGSLYGEGTIIVSGGTFYDNPSARLAKGYVVNLNANGTYTVIPATLKDGAVLDLGGVEYNGTIIVEGNVTIKGDTKINKLESTTGCTITIEDGKTLTLNNFSFGTKDNASAKYVINGGTIVASYGFFQHGKYELRSNFETGYMYYSYGSDITVYGTFHSQGKGDGLDYVRGKLTIARGGKSYHDKSLWVGQPASWGAMNATLTIEEGGYVQANSLSVYEGSTLTYSNDADLKYNSVTGTEYIIKK